MARLDRLPFLHIQARQPPSVRPLPQVSWDADASLGDFIILRSSGMPVYNFCVAVDDANMQVFI